jgi:myo-inositol-1(or 4)-monophosphatase
MSVDYEELKEFAARTALNAGSKLLEIKGSELSVEVIDREHKGLITKADRIGDSFVRKALEQKTPEYSLLSEEGEPKEGNEYQWVVDCPDGTNNFMRGNREWAVSIGLRHKGKGVLGVVYLPDNGDLYWAYQGRGAFRRNASGESRIHVSGKECLDMFTPSFATGIDFNEPEKWDRVVKALRASGLFRHIRRRMSESTAFDMATVARGGFDVHINNFAKPWDVAAGEVLINEAGGKVSYMGPVNEIMVAGNGVVHEEIVRIIKEVLEQVS